MTVYEFRFPFDWKTPLGYLLAVAFECTILLIAIFALKSLGIFAIGVFMFSISLTEDIKCDLDRIVANSSIKKIPGKTRLKIMNQIIALVQLHSKATLLSTFIDKICL